jgi:hypothetical protein
MVSVGPVGLVKAVPFEGRAGRARRHFMPAQRDCVGAAIG